MLMISERIAFRYCFMSNGYLASGHTRFSSAWSCSNSCNFSKFRGLLGINVITGGLSYSISPNSLANYVFDRSMDGSRPLHVPPDFAFVSHCAPKVSRLATDPDEHFSQRSSHLCRHNMFENYLSCWQCSLHI